jgi:uncharacterized membrane protein
MGVALDFIKEQDPVGKQYDNFGEILSGDQGLLSYIFVIAGVVLLVMLIIGGIGLMTSGGNPDKVKANYSRITSGLIGFLIIFVAYFVAQLVQVMLGIDFL